MVIYGGCEVRTSNGTGRISADGVACDAISDDMPERTRESPSEHEAPWQDAERGNIHREITHVYLVPNVVRQKSEHLSLVLTFIVHPHAAVSDQDGTGMCRCMMIHS